MLHTLPDGWLEVFDKHYQTCYYYSALLQKSTWDRGLKREKEEEEEEEEEERLRREEEERLRREEEERLRREEATIELELKIDVFALLDSFSNGKEDCCLDAWLSVEVADAAAARRKCENEDGIFCAYGIEQCEHDVARFATASNKVEQARIKIDTEKVKRERMEAELRRERLRLAARAAEAERRGFGRVGRVDS